MVLDGRHLQQRAHRARHAPMPTNYFADVARRYLESIHSYAIFLGLYDLQFIRVFDERVSHVFDELAGHSVGPASAATRVAVSVETDGVSATGAT